MLTKSLFILGLTVIRSSIAVPLSKVPSFTIPGGLSNGLYKAYYNAAGEEVHELVTAEDYNSTSLPATPAEYESSAKRHEVVKRWDSYYIWCGCGFNMNAGDTNVANACLANWAASSPVLGGDVAQYCIQNTAIAFAVNYFSEAVTIPSNLVSNNSPDISYDCGNFVAGTSALNGFVHLDYGYMNYYSGINLGTAPQAGSASVCPGTAGAEGICVSCINSCNADCYAYAYSDLGMALCEAECRDQCTTC